MLAIRKKMIEEVEKVAIMGIEGILEGKVQAVSPFPHRLNAQKLHLMTVVTVLPQVEKRAKICVT